MEEWREVVGFERYEVSNLGNIRTRLLVGGQGAFGEEYRYPAQHIRPPKPYKRVMLSDGVKKYNKQVHRLVLETFVGPCPEGMECRHRNGDGGDNKLSNLCWGTHLDNTQDKKIHGTTGVGVKNPRAVLTEVQVLEIRGSVWRYGMLSEYARKFGVSATQILRVRNNAAWSHV